VERFTLGKIRKGMGQEDKAYYLLKKLLALGSILGKPRKKKLVKKTSYFGEKTHIPS